jgi:hypothetical protein
MSLLYPGVNRRLSNSSGGGHDIATRETCITASLNVNNLGKAAELHLAFSSSSVAGAVPNLSCRILITTVLMSS